MRRASDMESSPSTSSQSESSEDDPLDVGVLNFRLQQQRLARDQDRLELDDAEEAEEEASTSDESSENIVGLFLILSHSSLLSISPSYLTPPIMT